MKVWITLREAAQKMQSLEIQEIVGTLALILAQNTF
jgi:hypothetical protein